MYFAYAKRNEITKKLLAANSFYTGTCDAISRVSCVARAVERSLSV